MIPFRETMPLQTPKADECRSGVALRWRHVVSVHRASKYDAMRNKEKERERKKREGEGECKTAPLAVGRVHARI